MIAPGEHLSLAIEKPAAGGRMIARAGGQIVFVSGAIPGERVRARVEQVKGGVGYATVVEIEDASPDRRATMADPACGGNVYAHVLYPRQLALKAEIVADAFARIAKLPLTVTVPVRASPEDGYRMRARLHLRNGRVGFFREGTHDLCAAGPTRQLLPETVSVIDAVARRLHEGSVRVVREIELSENVSATERALLVELGPGARPHETQGLPRLFEIAGVTGVAIVRPEAPQFVAGRGRPHVVDTLDVAREGQRARVTLQRHVSAFFQGNRFLLESLVTRVAGELIPRGPLLDLYAGGGLFGVSFAALGAGPVVVVESERHAAQDLTANAAVHGDSVRVVIEPVEAYLRTNRPAPGSTVLVDPPRTGMSREASAAIAGLAASRVIYVSCDVATLARDVRRFVDAGYELAHVEAFDLFPNTAHIECIALLVHS